jgi:hypothetical protein
MKTPKEEMLSAFAHLSVQALDKLLGTYEARNDSVNAGIVREALANKQTVQTDELSRCGKLFKHTHHDPETGRVTHTFTGDIRAAFAPFMEGAGPITARMDWKSFTGRNSPQARSRAASQMTVTVGPGEMVQVVKAAAEKGKH